jgi:hypothetical protein
LRKESEAFANHVIQSLETYRNGGSLTKSTNDGTGSLGGSGIGGGTDKMAAFKSRLNAVNNKKPTAMDLNRSIDRQSEFKSKMAQLKSKQQLNQSGIPGG